MVACGTVSNNEVSSPANQLDVPSGAIASASMPASVLGIVVNDKLEVIDVESQGAAEKAGIRIGDKIEAPNSTSVTSKADIAKLRVLIATMQNVEVQIIRGGKSSGNTHSSSSNRGMLLKHSLYTTSFHGFGHSPRSCLFA